MRGLKRSHLSLLQMAAATIFLCCGYILISSLVALPRDQAQAQVREPIPQDWNWVVVNHGKAYPWPYRGPVTVLAGLGATISVVFLVVTGIRTEPKR